MTNTLDLDSNLLDLAPPVKEPEWDLPIVAISIGRNARMQIIEIMNNKVANPHIIEMFDECCIEDELEFIEDVGIYRAEFSTVDTSYDTLDGREYDWDPVVTLKHKYNFITCKWDVIDDK